MYHVVVASIGWKKCEDFVGFELGLGSTFLLKISQNQYAVPDLTASVVIVIYIWYFGVKNGLGAYKFKSEKRGICKI